jgi:hypothetical protein
LGTDDELVGGQRLDWVPLLEVSEANVVRELDNLGRDVSAALAFLIEHQAEWRPEIIIGRTGTEFTDGSFVMSGGGQIADLTLIAVPKESAA